ncbi:MAG: hypothetical protein IMZ55_06100, partial [Acidobacteria bacterium]|nr:hypothetical protein [Acidobacteriota bacterium]
AWVKPHGKGRVFNTSFGHRTELFWNPRVLRFYLDAVQFAAGDLAAPTDPRAGARRREAEGDREPAIVRQGACVPSRAAPGRLPRRKQPITDPA